ITASRWRSRSPASPAVTSRSATRRWCRSRIRGFGRRWRKSFMNDERGTMNDEQRRTSVHRSSFDVIIPAAKKNTMSPWYLLLAFLFVLANGFFVAAEFALVKVRPTQLAELLERGSTRAKMTKRILKRLDAYLAAAQVGITFASLALGWIGEPAFATLLLPLLHSL